MAVFFNSMMLRIIGRYLLLGDVSASTASGHNKDFVNYNKFTAVSSGNATVLEIYSQGSASFKVGIYSDSAGNPNSLLVSTSSTAVVTGKNIIAISSTALVIGTDYWIAVNSNVNQSIGSVSSVGGTNKYESLAYANALPATATPSSSDTYILSASCWTAL